MRLEAEKQKLETQELKKELRQYSAHGMMEQFEQMYKAPPVIRDDYENKEQRKRVQKITDKFNCEKLTPLTWQLARKDSMIRTEHIPESIAKIKAHYPEIFGKPDKADLKAQKLKQEKSRFPPKDAGTTTDVEEAGVGYTKLIFGSNQIFDQ